MPEAPTINVGFADIVQGRAYLRHPFIAKVLLAHWAGAPWSDKDKDAFLHGLQVECLAHRERERIIHGASRLGKSVLGGCDLMDAWLLPYHKIAIVAKRYDHVSHEFQYLYAGIKKLFSKAPSAVKRLIYKHQQNYHDYDAEAIWATRCIGISVEADDGAQLLGRELTDIICGEGSHIPPNIGNTKMLRALDGAMMTRSHGAEVETGRVSVYTTPKEFEGWSAYEWERIQKQTQQHPEVLHYGRVPYAETVWIREADIKENPAYDIRVRDARQKTLDRRAFDEQYRGKMVHSSGRVYQHFDEYRHVVPMPPVERIREMRLGVGFDTGAYTGISLVGIEPDRTLWILGEVYTEKQTIWDSCAELRDVLIEKFGPAFGVDDRALVNEIISGVDVWSVDPASQHKIEIMEELDCALEQPNTLDQKSVLATTDLLDHCFKNDALYIVDDCTFTVDQYKKYVWKTMKSAKGIHVPVIKEPLKANDHLCDSSRFALVRMIEWGPAEKPLSPMDAAQTWAAAQRQMAFGPLQTQMEAARRIEEFHGIRKEGTAHRTAGAGAGRMLEVRELPS